jgi:hypothetical protein
MSGDLHRLTSSLMLKITEAALKFQGSCLGHGCEFLMNVRVTAILEHRQLIRFVLATEIL